MASSSQPQSKFTKTNLKNWKQNVIEAHRNLKWIMTEEEYKVAKAIEDNKMKAKKKARLLEEEQRKKAAPTASVKKAEPPPAEPKEQPVVSNVVIEENPTTNEVEESEIVLSDMKKDKLIELAKELKVSSRGNKKQLIERISAVM